MIYFALKVKKERAPYEKAAFNFPDDQIYWQRLVSGTGTASLLLLLGLLF